MTTGANWEGSWAQLQQRVAKVEGRMLYVENRQDNHAAELKALTNAIAGLRKDVGEIITSVKLFSKLFALAVALGPVVGGLLFKWLEK